MDATSLATLWATISLVIFIGLCIYLKVPGMITKALDQRADRIRNELEEAKRLREEAQALLAEYQNKRKQAEQEAVEIVETARREAAAVAEEATRKAEDYVARRTSMAEQKIAQAERDAISEVRSTAIDLAVEAARKVLADKTDSKADAELFKQSVADVKARLN
ncbi:F0F1 ATP synthase subunit B [Aquamicrobium segne]|uniref:ATP synthase subunit b n=1 Tax=Aquamicrobium segne TaxID=469547 RepID=A0ABW0GZ48_9HYPH